MLGDTEIQPPVVDPVAPQAASPVPPVVPPAPTYIPPRPKPPILPILFGFLVVIVVVAGIGIAYYKTKLTASALPSPTPLASVMATPSVEPSIIPTSTPDSIPKSSVKPTPKSVVTPTSTPIPAPTLDIRFGNPSANVKQTIDEGKGDGRVINREYTSIQVGEFDEVSSTWSPRVTVCFHFVSNENISAGKDLKYSFSLDDKITAEGDMGQYDKIEAGRLYDWCHDVTTDIGGHTAKLLLNPNKTLKETTYVNDLARLEWKNLADQIAPNFTLVGPTNEVDGTCFNASYISDNVTPNASLKREIKQDGGNWQVIQPDKYCLRGEKDSSHTMSFRITDARGNANEQSRTFVLY